METFLIFAGVLGLIGISIGVAYWMDRKRRDALQQIADELGLQFFPDGFDSYIQGVANLKLFNTGRARKQSKAVVAESEGTTLCIFDYSYTVGSGKNSRTYSQTVAAVQSSELQIPDFAIKNEGLLHRLGGLVGMQDIDFESHPKFSKMFLLSGSNEPAIRNLFRPQLLEYFETQKGVSVEGGYGGFVFYVPGKKVKPQDIKQFMSTAYEIYGQLVDSSMEVVSPNA